MTIFDYFRASGQVLWVDENREVTYWKRDGGVDVVPFDGSYKRWISESWYRPQTYFEAVMPAGCIEYKKPLQAFYVLNPHEPTGEIPNLLQRLGLSTDMGI